MIAVAVLLVGLTSCRLIDPAPSLVPITIGMEATAVNSLIYVATDQNYFATNGLAVTIKEYPSGLAAVNGMLNDEVDIATSSEFVVVGKAFEKASISAFGTIDQFLHIYLMARRDRGITEIRDLKGKKVGVPLKTAAEFYIGRFLDLHGMSIKDVTLVDIPPTTAVDALVNGDVDGVVIWRPSVNKIEDKLGAALVTWRPQSQQPAFCTLVSRNDWAAQHPELITRLIKALTMAESFSLAHPIQARAIVQRKLSYDDDYMASVWPEHELSVSLDQTFVLAMEDQARWMIRNKLTTGTITPNFLDYVNFNGLDAVKPGAVNVIR